MSQSYDFMRDRLEGQINYYSKQSGKNKKKYFATQTIIIVLGVIIPIVNFIAIGNIGNTQLSGFFLFVSTILASIISFTAALSQLNKHYESWLNYRNILELLKREKSLYQNSAGGYFNLSEVDKKRMFVERVEELLSSEHTKFFSTFQQQMESLQYVKDILNKVNDLKSIDVNNRNSVANKLEPVSSTSITDPTATSTQNSVTNNDANAESIKSTNTTITTTTTNTLNTDPTETSTTKKANIDQSIKH